MASLASFMGSLVVGWFRTSVFEVLAFDQSGSALVECSGCWPLTRVGSNRWGVFKSSVGCVWVGNLFQAETYPDRAGRSPIGLSLTHSLTHSPLSPPGSGASR